MLLFSLEASDELMVLTPYVVSKMLECLTTNWCLSSSTTLARNTLGLQVFWDGFHSVCMEVWSLIMDPAVEVLFSSRCNLIGLRRD